MEISACPKCGNRNIRIAQRGDGAIYPGCDPTKYVCDNCLYLGMPITFSSEKEYEIFLKKVAHKTTNDYG